MWSRLGGVAAHPDNAFRLLHDDHQLVLVFPEGTKGTGKTYRDRYKLHRFGRAGFVEIAMRSGVPVIPIAVVGNEEAMPILFKSRRLAALTNLPYAPITANISPSGCSARASTSGKFRIRVLPPVHFGVPDRAPRAGDGGSIAFATRSKTRLRHAACRSVWFDRARMRFSSPVSVPLGQPPRNSSRAARGR
jgi:hypothetical protein